MNIGTIVTQGLLRNELPVFDLDYRDMATQMLDEIIQEHWTAQPWLFAKSKFYLNTIANVDEYSLNKLVAGIQAILPNSMRGSDPVRLIRYKPAQEFYRTRPFSIETADPYRFREGQVRGIETQVSASSQITLVSSLTNYTTGTVAVIQGSKRVVITTGAISQDMIGRWFRVGTEPKAYRIVSRDLQTSTVFYLDDPYESTTTSPASYTIGDIQQKVTILGYDANNVIVEEEVQLNGSTAVVSAGFFSGLVRITKSDKTGGYIKATSNGGVITNVILDPGETEVDYQTIVFDPIPSKSELISFEAEIRHPHLYKSTDAPLFPNQFHPLLVLDLIIKISTEFKKEEVPQSLTIRRDKMYRRMVSVNNNTDNWTIQQETEASSERSKVNNLPNNFGQDENGD